MDPLLVVGAGALLFSIASFAMHFRRRKLTLQEIAVLACNSGEHNESPTVPRWRISHEAGVKLDLGDNGKRDYSDAQLRIAIDAEALKRGWKR
jgi:hypothetical protein